MPKILAIFEEVPDTTSIATLDATPEQMATWKTYNRSFVNSTDLTEEDTNTIVAFGELVKEAAYESDDTSGGTFDAVIIMGIIL